MGIRAFFHKIRMGFVRKRESSIPYVTGAKRYGDFGEDSFTYMLCRELPACQIKRNVVVSTPEGCAEIDCLVQYQNKLFAIEVKSWKGRLTEQGDSMLQEKIDRWTGETHTKYLKSPFRQLARAIYLLKNQVPIPAWINAVVFFESAASDSVSIFSENIWFDRMDDLLHYIQNGGRASSGRSAALFFESCTPSDHLYATGYGRSLHCIIDRASLRFQTPQGSISTDRICSIRLLHRWSYDELHIRLKDGSEQVVTLENAKIKAEDNGLIKSYALCKLDRIELGRTVNSFEHD